MDDSHLTPFERRYNRRFETKRQPPQPVQLRLDPPPAPILTTEQLGILQHALGVDQYGRGEMYRNHFCAGEKDETICRELVEIGLMTTFTRSYLPYYNCTVTEAGKAAVVSQSPNPPKLTRSQARYRNFLSADTGEPFIEWLKRHAR
jgi:hypothetical protein